MKKKSVFTGLILALLLSSCTRDYDENLTIVYHHNDGAYTQIMIMDDDGTNVKQLTNTLSNNSAASWASDGDRILFISAREGPLRMFIMNSDGTGVVRVSSLAAFFPTWSPDGNIISYYHNVDGDQELYLINPDGTGVTQLTINSPIVDMYPSWFPDSDRIAFLRDGDIYTILKNGTGINQVTFTTGVSSLAVSPDGNRIAYEYSNAIWVMNSDGTGAVNLTSAYTSIAWRPSWSPSGDRIVFASGNSPREICIINSNGTAFRQLTSDSLDDDSPCFQGKPR